MEKPSPQYDDSFIKSESAGMKRHEDLATFLRTQGIDRNMDPNTSVESIFERGCNEGWWAPLAFGQWLRASEESLLPASSIALAAEETHDQATTGFLRQLGKRIVNCI
jgi:hypothetical protein